MADMQLVGSYPSAPDRQLAGAPLDLGRIKVELQPLGTYFNASSSIPDREVPEKYDAFLKLANAAGLLTGKSHAGSVSSSLAGTRQARCRFLGATTQSPAARSPWKVSTAPRATAAVRLARAAPTCSEPRATAALLLLQQQPRATTMTASR